MPPTTSEPFTAIAEPRQRDLLGALASGEGERRMYSLNGLKLREVHDWVKTYERFWDHQLRRIKERAERLEQEERTGTGNERPH